MTSVRRHGWVIKNLSTGELDVDTSVLTFDPTGHAHHDLIDGYEWVKVKIIYEEIG